MRFLNPFTIIIAIIIISALVAVGYYNSFVSQTNAIEGQWKQVEVQYQRRVDLIPNLVESVKGLQKQEQKIFGDVSAARANYVGAKNAEGKVQAANQLEGALSRLIAIFENYPQIKSDQAVLKLMDELAGTENRVAVERRRYNEIVQGYNTSVSTLPGKLFASLMGFQPKTYFQAAPGSENVPKVNF
ncbi:TPA: LemA family protein [Candidatus Daviesbacteria bacterium]|uniref:LemA protein n=1 Tax=Candidatus Daviesbacteria bacterium GW2011_GWF2_38_6 TaxID=1618432 RepID=A0A0G0KU21_9BACT|nr:MAG: lemA protein [Candidatus Daviesbacteria bacterium GW2011_GWF2_38_6]OGE27297.1 MAG: LemA family protein [Candidatus Daviesbacteria bacterium RIFCSPHIGHO2_02_FULL_39_41]OGE28150.1 MAG: LemA family protein [Candidatus Daviesbacteria bacterium RIFCSPHIGHO2_01_FULL_38_8b]OGE45862.1 MAG: LemA family protein [Candidatus Daviesbacteria bacterium RIFCSPHIGHO2_12_FULL_38_25]OGE68153.1 MAG: LemA family protein [Candidatus Daviesbacteria bacterium RIFCSPLOWO2_02_FULL_38_18]OGE73446.1 MAG: LemA fam